MKNILIVETSKGDTGSIFNWFSDINDIPDLNMRKAVIDAINNTTRLGGKIDTIDGIIFTSHTGYYFSNLPRTNPPYIVDFIVEHIF